jgi:hypothetical protein
LLNDEQFNKNELPISVKELENVNGESKDLQFTIKVVPIEVTQFGIMIGEFSPLQQAKKELGILVRLNNLPKLKAVI